MQPTQELLELYHAYAFEESACRRNWYASKDAQALYRANECRAAMDGMLLAARAMGVDPEDVKGGTIWNG